MEITSAQIYLILVISLIPAALSFKLGTELNK